MLSDTQLEAVYSSPRESVEPQDASLPNHSAPRHQNAPAAAAGRERIVLHVGSEFRHSAPQETPSVVQIQSRPQPLLPTDTHRIVRENWTTEPEIPVTKYFDSFGTLVTRLTLPAGESVFSYDAHIEVSALPDPIIPDAVQHPIEELPDEVLIYTLSSRYCLSDVAGNWAWQQFGQSAPGWARVQAVCDWLHANIEYKSGSSNPWTTSDDVLKQGSGICRDFAHTGITLCRALNIPARYVFGYFPDIDVPPPDVPMDFHAWFEVWLGGAWRTFDARHNVPRIGRIPIGRGRDAVDCALITTYGPTTLLSMTVWSDEAEA